MPFWDHPEAKARVPVTEIVVRASCDDRDQPRYLTMDVQNFVLHMLQIAHYPRHSLPREAVLSAAVDYYICTVENGGHNGFIGNSCWNPGLRHDIREGLALLGLDEPTAIFADLEEFARSDPARFEASDWTDPILDALDNRFFALSREAVFERHAAWLRSLPNLRVVPDAQYHAVMDALAAANRKRWWRH